MRRSSLFSLPVVVLLAGCAQILGLGDYQEGGGGQATTTNGPGTGSSSSGEGGGAPKPCEKDADCTNNLFCDGIEHCGDDNLCSAGTPPCPAPSDTAHCETPCTETAQAAVCGTVTAKDADSDGHGDPNCAQAPGDDCDDADPLRFPGNPEVCDAIDNDCNSEVDEELPATGASVEVGGSDGYVNAHLAFSPGLGVYGVAYVVSTQEPQINLTFRDQAGASTAGSIEMADPFNQGMFDMRPRVAANDTEFAVVWHDEDDVNSGIFMSLAAPGGSASAPIFASDFEHGGSSPDIVTTPAGDFIVVWINPINTATSILAQRIAANGDLMGNQVTIVADSAAKYPQIVRNGNKYAVVWHDTVAGAPTLLGRAFDDSFTFGDVTTLASPSTLVDHAVTTFGTGFAVGWHEPGGQLGVAVLDADLAPQTSSTAVAGVSGWLSMASSGTELLVLESNSNTSPKPIARIHRFDAALDILTAPLQISESNLIDTETGYGSILSTSLGVGVVWDNVRVQIESDERAMFRGLGSNLCN